jgi:aspartate/methionine/tyrosine aminotransferase
MPTAAQIDSVATGEDLTGLLIASPANPTGTMLEADRLEQIASVCRQRRLWLISDEIYHGLTYALREATALQTATMWS